MATISTLPAQTQTAQTPVPLTPVSSPASSSGGLSFGDILDIINPLQHIPVLSSVYRSVTGSTISPAAQIAGDTLYGAAIGGAALAGAALGFAGSVANVTVQQQTGKDIAGNVLSALNNSSAPAITALTPADAATTQAALLRSATQQPQSANVLHAYFNQSFSPQLPNAQYQRTQAFDAINKQLVKMAV